MDLQQKQLQQLIVSAQQQHADVSCSPPHAHVVVKAAADSGSHPILISFPSFDAAADSGQELQQHQPPHTQPHDSSSVSSPDRLQPTTGSSASASPSSHSRRVGVSLLSQQIACARTLALPPSGASTVGRGGAVAVDEEGSGRHRGQFWRYLQVGGLVD